jgi:hypothetical protein
MRTQQRECRRRETGEVRILLRYLLNGSTSLIGAKVPVVSAYLGRSLAYAFGGQLAANLALKNSHGLFT